MMDATSVLLEPLSYMESNSTYKISREKTDNKVSADGVLHTAEIT